MGPHSLEHQPSEAPAGHLSPAEREAPWTVWARFAIEAASEVDARAIADRVFAQMEATASGEPQVIPFRRRPGSWVATAHMDLTVLPSLEPDNARTRLSYLAAGLGGVTWGGRVTERQGKWEWPPDIWSREPGKDDVLVHPAVLAAILWVSAADGK